MSSKRRLRRAKCTGKVRHADEAAAKQAIYKLTRKMTGALGHMQPYRCGLCGGWHIGHSGRSAW